MEFVESIRDRVSGNALLQPIYRLLIVFISILLILSGVAMLVLPGPGIVVILFGFALLGTEFPWAKRLVQRAMKFLMAWKIRIITWWNNRKS